MTDKKWQSLMNKTTMAHAKYLDLLEQIEDEYVRRYGVHPSACDDDYWIDSFQQSAKGAKVEDIIREAEYHHK